MIARTTRTVTSNDWVMVFMVSSEQVKRLRDACEVEWEDGIPAPVILQLIDKCGNKNATN